MEEGKQSFLYQHLADEIAGRIRDGIYQPGEKLPSIRKLHEQSHLSISTVYKAFLALESLGLVEARPKSGYYVKPVVLSRIKAPRLKKLSLPPQKVRLRSVINSVVAAINNPDLLPLGMTVTDPRLLPVKSFGRILKGLTQDDLKGLLSYSLSEGQTGLRRKLALQTIGMVDGIRPEDLLITNGCMEAVALSLMAVTRPGDTVAIESPTNFNFLQLLKELGLMVLEVPTDPRDGVDIDALDALLNQNRIAACLFMPNFHNPLGALMPDEQKEKLVGLLNKREIPVIEDDISAELYFGAQRPVPLKAFDRKDLVLTCCSFSKTLAPGLRIGWVIPGRRFMEKIQNLKAGITVSTSSLDQYLVCRVLGTQSYERHLNGLRASLKKQTYRTALAIQKYFPKETRLAVPRGGSLLWVQLPDGIDGFVVHEKALGHHIAVIPGGVCSNSNQFTNFIQISCGAPFSKHIDHGLNILGGIIKKC